MRSFSYEIAQHNLTTSNFGLHLRVFGGAVLSTVDLIIDVYMAVQFYSTGSEGYGTTNVILIGTTMIVQLIAAYGNNSKKLSHFFQDAFCILIGFKPALDAYRVGSGAEKSEHQAFEPLAEMTVCKFAEVIFQALPSSVLQIYALLLAEQKSVDALISILVSAATIAFTSSMISYDWDSSPAKRKQSPLFYGYVPDRS